MTSSEMPGSTASVPPGRLLGLWRTRAASPASCRFMPWSMMFDSTCQWPCGCIGPPITPNGMNGLPSLVTNPGMLVWSERLCGASELRWPSSSVKPEPRFWSAKPRSAGTIFEPKLPKMLSMSEMAFRSLSTTVR